MLVSLAPPISPEDLQRIYVEALARRPGISVVDEATFGAAALGTGLDADAIFSADLLLALGCLARDPACLAIFEAEHMLDAHRALSRLKIDAHEIDELLQAVRTKILVGTEAGAPPKIASYVAKGPLGGWVRAIAVHEAMSAKRKEARRGPHEGVSAVDRMPLAGEIELEHLRELYAVPFKAAFGEVLATLTPRDRNVLRLVYLDGLTADQVGLAYGVHRVSVARWLQQIRATLFSQTKSLLIDRLRLTPSELESVARMCLSQIDVSLDRLLVDLEK